MSRTRLLTVVTTLALLFGMQLPAHALTVSPPVYDYTLNPGDTIRDTIKLHNESSSSVTIYPELFNFTYTEGDEVNGTPSFYPPNEEKNGHELAPWIKTNTSPVTLSPDQRLSLDFTLNVPKTASPGSHFGSIQLRTAPSGTEGGSAVSLIGGTGILILARVSGNVNDTLDVGQFSGDKSVYTHLPVDLHIRLENKGNTHLRPTGNVFIQNMFGKQVASIQVNADFRSILPGSARRFESRWSKHTVHDTDSEFSKEWRNFAFGKYTALMALNYGSANAMKQVGGSYTFWVFPWQVILVLLVGLAVLLAIFVVIMKYYNRAVIRAYENKQKKQ